MGLRYGDTVALDAIDLDIPSACMVGLIGPDGVGKSSLMALVAGVRVIQQGRVETLGGDMGSRAHREAVCPRIAYMPQGLGRNLYMTLSVFENVDFFGRLFGQATREREARIAELLDSTGLAAFRDRDGLTVPLLSDPDHAVHEAYGAWGEKMNYGKVVEGVIRFHVEGFSEILLFNAGH